jgi:hypothetical protein
MQAAIGGGAVMNVNSGGPHILLFERDQQLTTLLTSEFQLAGYECHPARTAVEVFDAIARYPIRLVLVNLAQPAAGRREFWVALDAQRRGRGVQVLTFRCMNIAGYGADDSEETSRTVLTDMEVDGMMGVMNLVDAVRSRIPGSTTGSFSRISAIPGANTQDAGNPNKLKGQAEVVGPSTAPETTSQTAASLSMLSTRPSMRTPSSSNPTSAGPVNPASGFTDKIRAVIYPSSRSFSPMPETNWVPHNPQNLVSTQRGAGAQDAPVRPQGKQSSGESDIPLLNREAGPQRQSARNIQSTPERVSNISPSQGQESGLAQLSRMVRESHITDEDEVADMDTPTRPTSPRAQQETQQAHPVDANSISALPLRASPIEDIQIEREQEYRGGRSTAQSTQTVDAASRGSGVGSAPPVPSSSPIAVPLSKKPTSAGKTELQHVEEETIISGAREEDVIARILAEMPQLSEAQTLNQPSPAGTTSDDMLLDIVQSLPPMSSLPTPPPQPKTPVLSGRATRTLGSVLLEGHLVPQHRLEVAQHVQRMLRGVDMNYQLGEILLMFKLLTPDQLLAASLVSYSLISTAQISALGRIRQELHSIGLEYDLESLLVLFRILTPDQLREVRASWSG